MRRMREAEFRAWLDKRLWRGALLTKKAKDSRVRRIQRLERGLGGLGFAEQTLEALFDADQWVRLTQRLTELKANPTADTAAARSVVPEAENPTGQLGNLLAAATQYGYFLEGRDPNYRAGDDPAVGEENLGLTREAVKAVLLEYDQGDSAFMSKHGFATNFDYVVFRPGESQRYPAKAVFLVAYSSIPGNPDLTAKGRRDTFPDTEGGPIHSEFRRLGYEVENLRRSNKEVLANRIRQHVITNHIEPARQRGDHAVTIRSGDVHKELGLVGQLPNVCQAIEGEKLREATGLGKPEILSGPASGRGSNMVYRFVLMPGQHAPEPLSDAQILARFEGNPDFRSRRPAWTSEQRAAFCRMARAVNSVGLDWYHTDIPEIRFGRKSSQLSRAEGTLGSLQFRMEGQFLKFSHQNVLLGLGGDYAFDANAAERFEGAMADAESAIRSWRPNSPDRPGKWPNEYGQSEQVSNESTEMTLPTNLILYGPPGTGKTYNTALEAVKLCDGGAGYPLTKEGRATLMERYNELQRKGRIGFVTFHQNYGYEDFVEGLRPLQAETDEEGSASTGFSLVPRDGVFKQISKIAAENKGRAVTADLPPMDGSRKIFKMSLGRSWSSEDDAIFENALVGKYVVLGWGGNVDWSDPKYDDWEEIKKRWRQDHPDASGNDPNMSQMYTFRANMEVGSVIIISDGNMKFRAIAEVTGPYQYLPGPDGEYNHRRSVRWLWHSTESLPRERIYRKSFSQVSAYQMRSASVEWEALGQIISSSGDAVATSGAPESYVLIIDEINRANVSKVFGELITLIEPDKRTGMDNALSVKLPYSGETFSVPANLNLIGTMNTADRSIALLDTALRRRFNFREMAPDPGLLTDASTRTGIDLVRVLTTINQRIEYLIDREHRIGHAFFIGCETADHVQAAMRDKVIPLLQEYFFEDWSRIHAVLGPGFIGSVTLKCPLNEGEDRKSWFVRLEERPDGSESFPDDAFAQLIGKVVGIAEEPNE